ncbi:hypothetical protein BB561_001352 [Smittium simulii]|uniref:C2H2-type domain-containing protein n=1 Tax=Smittium simulii TaxID=133385 RepID=A0A2T9YV47_9FUNG|nr:hypothetical protein BB561_001352 [Smittium simulii]
MSLSQDTLYYLLQNTSNTENFLLDAEKSNSCHNQPINSSLNSNCANNLEFLYNKPITCINNQQIEARVGNENKNFLSDIYSDVASFNVTKSKQLNSALDSNFFNSSFNHNYIDLLKSESLNQNGIKANAQEQTIDANISFDRYKTQIPKTNDVSFTDTEIDLSNNYTGNFIDNIEKVNTPSTKTFSKNNNQTFYQNQNVYQSYNQAQNVYQNQAPNLYQAQAQSGYNSQYQSNPPSKELQSNTTQKSNLLCQINGDFGYVKDLEFYKKSLKSATEPATESFLESLKNNTLSRSYTENKFNENSSYSGQNNKKEQSLPLSNQTQKPHSSINTNSGYSEIFDPNKRVFFDLYNSSDNVPFYNTSNVDPQKQTPNFADSNIKYLPNFSQDYKNDLLSSAANDQLKYTQSCFSDTRMYNMLSTGEILPVDKNKPAIQHCNKISDMYVNGYTTADQIIPPVAGSQAENPFDFDQVNKIRAPMNLGLDAINYQNLSLNEFHHLFNNIPSCQGQSMTTRPFKCKICNQSFSRNHDLKRHVKIHTGVKPYKCKKCNKRFGRSDALKRHSMVKRCRMVEPSNGKKEDEGSKNEMKTISSTKSTSLKGQCAPNNKNGVESSNISQLNAKNCDFYKNKEFSNTKKGLVKESNIDSSTGSDMLIEDKASLGMYPYTDIDAELDMSAISKVNLNMDLDFDFCQTQSIMDMKFGNRNSGSAISTCTTINDDLDAESEDNAISKIKNNNQNNGIANKLMNTHGSFDNSANLDNNAAFYSQVKKIDQNRNIQTTPAAQTIADFLNSFDSSKMDGLAHQNLFMPLKPQW